jgi:hypothetical protein
MLLIPPAQIVRSLSRFVGHDLDRLSPTGADLLLVVDLAQLGFVHWQRDALPGAESRQRLAHYLLANFLILSMRWTVHPAGLVPFSDFLSYFAVCRPDPVGGRDVGMEIQP